MKDELKAVYNVGKKVLDISKWAFLLTHAAPTAWRKINDYTSDSDEGVGLVTIVSSVSYSVALLIPGFAKDNHYLIGAGAFCVASNVASGLYELYKYENNKLKTSTTNPTVNPSSSGLEEKVEERVEEIKPEIKPVQPKPVEIIDPWKVRIEELENIYSGGRKEQ